VTDKKIQMDLTLRDQASKPLEKIADTADDLTADPIELEATADVERAADDLTRVDRIADDVDALHPTVDVDTNAAKAADELAGLGPGAQHGAAAAGQALRELGGPIGDVVDKAQTLNEAVAGAMAGIGVAPGALSALAGPIAGVSIAVAGLAAVWSKVRQGQEEARQRARDYADAIDEAGGALEKAARNRLGESLSDDDVRLLDRYHLTMLDVADAMQGHVTPALAELRRNFPDGAELARAAGAGSPELQQLAEDVARIDDLISGEAGGLARGNELWQARNRVMGDAVDQADDLTKALDRTRDALDVEQEALDLKTAVASALDSAGESADQSTQDVLDLKKEIVAAAELAKVSPVELQSTIDKVSAGDLAGAAADAQAWLNRHPVSIITQLAGVKVSGSTNINLSGAGGTGRAGVTNVVVNMPRGMRYDAAAARAMNRYARRNGGRVLRRQ
jgi:hypothetical protein